MCTVDVDHLTLVIFFFLKSFLYNFCVLFLQVQQLETAELSLCLCNILKANQFITLVLVYKTKYLLR